MESELLLLAIVNVLSSWIKMAKSFIAVAKDMESNGFCSVCGSCRVHQAINYGA